jgi:4-hydroxy-3-polyprenylbenzoate decarboxylase
VAYTDLRAFMADLESRGLLKRIKIEVDAELEITEISDRVVKNGGPALLFESVKGYKMPVVTNLFGTLERMKMALGVNDLEQIGEEVLNIIQPAEMPSTFIDKLKALPKLAVLSSFIPKIIKYGPCKEVIFKDKPSLAEIPVLKCWPDDGGPFITLPLVFTKDPETGRRNVGMYRMQVYDECTTGMHWHIHKDAAGHYAKKQRDGKDRMPVAVVLGADPAVIFSATAPLPQGIDEILFAGFLRKEPVELVKCETVDIEVPAHAEIILEGYVSEGETRLEGPFGDHTGYYSLADQYPVFHLTCVTRRKNPVYPSTIVGRPPMEDAFIGKATERIFLPLMRLQLPEVIDMNMPPEGVFHNCVIVSIKKRYPGHAKKVMSALWGMGLMMLAKLIIVVDESVDVQNVSEVMWRVFNNIDARRDVMLVEGPLDALDHSSPMPHLGTKMGIDATRKWPSEGHLRQWPGDILMNDEVKKLVDGKWDKYGI